jgi:ABC-type amino acid transport substrate-binding protein
MEMDDFRTELIDPHAMCVATEGDFPPFSALNYLSGHECFSGIEMSIFSEICRRLGIEYRPVRASWSSILSGLNNGQTEDPAFQFDCSSASMDITEQRCQQFFMTRPYYESKCVLVTPESSPILPAEADSPDLTWRGVLVGRRVVTIESSTFAASLRDLGAIVLTTPAVGRLWLDMLLSGAADAFASEEANALDLAAAATAAGDSLRVHAAAPLRRARKGFAVPRRSPRLFAAIDAAMADMAADANLLDRLVLELSCIISCHYDAIYCQYDTCHHNTMHESYAGTLTGSSAKGLPRPLLQPLLLLARMLLLLARILLLLVQLLLLLNSNAGAPGAAAASADRSAGEL